MGFVLDDVRESFTNDITRFLNEIEKGSKAIVSAVTIATPMERTWQAPINSMAVGLHGIVGSASLVGVDSLSVSARRLEDIANLATESVRMLRAHSNRLKRIAAVCLEGSSDLRVMLEHELAGRAVEAEARRALLGRKLDQATQDIDDQLQPPRTPEAIEPERSAPIIAAKLPAVPPRLAPAPRIPAVPSPAPQAPLPDDGWDDIAATPVPTASAPMSPDDELAAVFQAEAREALTNLRGFLTRLENQPSDREAATQCSRLFHLLKGAAASVGLAAVSDRAHDLQAEVEKMKAGGIDATAVAQLRLAAEAFISFAVPDLAAATGTPAREARPADPADEEPRLLFRQEAQTSLDEARVLLKQVRETSGTARGVLTNRIERILHRLKGSALIVGEAQAAAVASRGQALCEALDRVDPTAVGNVIEQLAAMVVIERLEAPVRGPSLVRINLPRQDEWDVYLEESTQLLEDLDNVLGTIEGSSRPTAEISNLFRSYHTLKGATNAVGLTPIGQHLHIIETFLERLVASPQLGELRGIVQALSEQNEQIRRNISRASTEGEVTTDLERVQARLSTLSADRPTGSGVSWINPNDSAWSAGADGERPRRRSRSHASEHESQHDVAASAESEAESEAEKRDHDVEDTVRVDRRFIRVPADRLDSLLDLAGELVVCRSRMLSRVSRIQRLQEDDLVRHELVIQLVDGFASSTQFTNLDGRRRRLAGSSGDTVMGFGALELDQYEEIHVLSRRLDEAASDINEVRRDMGSEMSNLTEDAEMLSTIASGLQSEITRARMLTVDTLFSRLRLPIRDAAQRSNREVEIVTIGETIAVDKSMSDALYGPLLHMVRNAVVHGIENPERRTELGKPRAGTVTLTAKQVHGEIVLELSDDGGGINVTKLREIAIQRGLLPATVAESDPRVVEMIFAKGISTLETAGDVAGRGLGGNVVKRAIDRLNGSIQISTQRGVGTTFRITLPLSMSITQAVLVRVGGVLLAIPIAYAETILNRDSVEMVDSFGRIRANIGGRLVPVHVTRRIFDEKMLKSPTTDKVLVVCIVGGERVAIQVDEVVGQEEIVVKTLGALLDGHPLFAGSTAQGDGELALILDVAGILESETTGERRALVHVGPVSLPATPRVAADGSVSKASEQLLEGESARHSGESGVLDPAARRLEKTGPASVGIELTEIVAVPTGRLRILFVDDSLSVRKVAERMLTGLDVDVMTAVDGQDALEKLRAMAFSLVFTDLEMPRMHGYELIREMQLLPAYKAIPVVVISSRSGQKHIDQAISMGAREYLTKPFSPEILNAVLERLAKRGA